MTTTTTVGFQIVPLYNCTECIDKVKRTLHRLVGVELQDGDFENGKFTIKTTRNPEDIRAVLQHKFADKSVFMSRRSNHSNPSSAVTNPRNSSIQGPFNYRDMEALMAASRANGAQSVEFTQSSTVRFNFNNQPSTSGTATNGWDSEDGGYGYVNGPPRSQQYQPTTSGYGGVRNEDFGYGHGHGHRHALPPPPRTTTKASAPLIPTAEAQGYVDGYPIQLYRDDDYKHGGCCTIV